MQAPATSDPPPRPDLLQGAFRANPDYELVLFDRLPASYQEALAGLKDDPDFYGLLTAPNGKLRSKAVSQQTALLFASLRSPGRLPFYVLARGTEGLDRSIAQLVSDGVLEVDVGAGFVSGPMSHDLLFPSTTDEQDLGFLSRLSLDAIRYGSCLKGLGSTELSSRLYYYNRIPISANWCSRVGDTDELWKFWGIPRGIGSTPGGGRWQVINTESADWMCWRRTGAPGRTSDHQATFKLYVSPQPEDVAHTLAATVEALNATGAPSLKIGGTLPGLLRPDKIVCYFESFDQLTAAASELRPKLEGVRAQGVPFTSGLDRVGLISWGVDPAATEQAFGWRGRQSWRLWITNHLAASLVTVGPGSLPPWKFALDRLSLEGVDPSSWAPADLSRLASASDESRGVGAWN